MELTPEVPAIDCETLDKAFQILRIYFDGEVLDETADYSVVTFLRLVISQVPGKNVNIQESML